jgi:hypothetical protein
MKQPKRIWSREELIIAYYIAKWDYNGLSITSEDIVDIAIKGSSKSSLNMHVANFRHLLNIDGYKLEHTSKLMDEVVEEMKNKTVTQVRGIVNMILDKKEDELEAARVKRKNAQIAERAEKANVVLFLIFENKVKAMQKHRRLRKLSTKI